MAHYWSLDGHDNLPTNFGASETFRSRLISQNLPDASRDLATLTFDLGHHGDCRIDRSLCRCRQTARQIHDNLMTEDNLDFIDLCIGLIDNVIDPCVYFN